MTNTLQGCEKVSVEERINHYSFSHNIVLIFFSLAAVILAFFWNSLFFSVSVLLLLLLGSVLANLRGGIQSPNVIFVLFFVVYSLWFPLRVLLLESSHGIIYINRDYLLDTVEYSLLGLASYFIGVFLANVLWRNRSASIFIEVNNDIKHREVQVLVAVVCVLGIFYFISLGASSKRDLLDSGGALARVYNFVFVFLAIVTAFTALRLQVSHRLIDKLFLGCAIVFSFLFMMAAGERDVLFRVMMVVFFVFVDFRKKYTGRAVLAVFLGAIMLVPLSQGMKAAFLSGSVRLDQVSLELILGNEFISASRNLYALIAYGVGHDFSFFWKDIARGLFPDALLGGFVSLESTTSWYNNTYRVDAGYSGTSGWGFGLLAQGYLIGKGLGVFLLMFLIGFSIGGVYRLRATSSYWYVFYVVAVLGAIYAVRADMATFLSQTIKLPGFFCVFLWVVHHLKIKGASS